MVKKAINVTREIYANGYFFTASWDALERGIKTEEGRAYSFLTSMLFCAFTLEAYLNNVGNKKIAIWDELERSLSPKQKLLLISESANYRLDIGQRPFQVFSEIFKFRDNVVHAKAEKFEIQEAELDENGFLKNLPTSKWLEKCTQEQAELFYENTEKMLIELHKNIDSDGPSPYMPETSSWRVIQVDQEE